MSTARPSPGWRRSTTARPRWPGARTTATAASSASTRASSTPAAAAARTAQGEKVIFGLTTSIQSIGEGNYGRLGPGQQQRYTHALAETMFSEPATGGTPDEQPGAMPEIFPSPDQGPNIDRCWTCRSMFMQAWGNYGTAWAVVHQWLGVRPELGDGRVAFVPQVPPGQSSVRGQNPPRVRIGGRGRQPHRTPTPPRSTSTAWGEERRHRAHASARDAAGGRRARWEEVHNYKVVETNRGNEVTLPTSAGHHTLTITS